jgi:hypothetical protein
MHVTGHASMLGYKHAVLCLLPWHMLSCPFIHSSNTHLLAETPRLQAPATLQGAARPCRRSMKRPLAAPDDLWRVSASCCLRERCPEARTDAGWCAGAYRNKGCNGSGFAVGLLCDVQHAAIYRLHDRPRASFKSCDAQLTLRQPASGDDARISSPRSFVRALTFMRWNDDGILRSISSRFCRFNTSDTH